MGDRYNITAGYYRVNYRHRVGHKRKKKRPAQVSGLGINNHFIHRSCAGTFRLGDDQFRSFVLTIAITSRHIITINNAAVFVVWACCHVPDYYIWKCIVQEKPHDRRIIGQALGSAFNGADASSERHVLAWIMVSCLEVSGQSHQA